MRFGFNRKPLLSTIRQIKTLLPLLWLQHGNHHCASKIPLSTHQDNVHIAFAYQVGQIVQMMKGSQGRLFPRIVKIDEFCRAA